tara:strand:+ start:101 stop:997 length:897 start_codon:yes stop_codon:yes gene_type:complete
MGNANKLIWYIILPIILFLYVIFLIWSETLAQNQHWDYHTDIHSKNIISLENPEGFILGGSNANAISASIMSNELNEKWYNLSLTGEGGNDKNYWRYIKLSISKENRDKVQNIVYSSATPLDDYGVRNRNSYFFRVLNSPKLLFLPYRSLISQIKGYFTNKEALNFFDSLGDKRFDSSMCINQTLTILNRTKTNQSVLSSWVVSQLHNLKDLFPNAKITFVMPSEYYSSDEPQKIETVFKVINESINYFMSINKTTVTLVKQPPFPSIEMLCDDSLHANSAGRVWRTNNLLNTIQIGN